MRKSFVAAAVLALWLALLAGAWVAGARRAGAEPVACTITCTCKEVEGYFINRVLQPRSALYYRVNEAQEKVFTTHAPGSITTTGGCESGTPVQTVQTVYEFSGNHDTTCLVPVPQGEGELLYEAVHNPGVSYVFPQQLPAGTPRKLCGADGVPEQ